MDSKGSFINDSTARVILFALGLLVILGLIALFAVDSAGGVAYEGLDCQLLIAAQETTGVGAGGVSAKLPLGKSCYTMTVKTPYAKRDAEELVKKDIAERMARSWEITAKGTTNLWDYEFIRIWGGSNKCLLLYQIVVDKDADFQEISSADLEKYLREETFYYGKEAGRDIPVKYYYYITQMSNPGNIVVIDPIKPGGVYGIAVISPGESVTGWWSDTRIVADGRRIELNNPDANTVLVASYEKMLGLPYQGATRLCKSIDTRS